MKGNIQHKDTKGTKRRGNHLARIALGLALIFIVPVGSGCSLFQPSPVSAPDVIDMWPGLDRIRAGKVTSDAFSLAFPPNDGFILLARATARQGRFSGTLGFDLSLRANAEKTIRLQGRHWGDQTTLFDLLMKDQQLKVSLPAAKILIDSKVPAEGSPFKTRFGIEPWELTSVILIGQQLARTEFTVQEHRWGYTLTMSQADGRGDGLATVEIDKKTGLPRHATWLRGRGKWDVEYKSWKIFGDLVQADAPAPDIMPSQFVIKSKSPRATIEIGPRDASASQQYRKNPPGDENWARLERPSGSRLGSLEDLDQVLSGGTPANK